MIFRSVLLFSSLLFFFCTPGKKARTVETQPFAKNVLISMGNKGDAYGPCEPSIAINHSNIDQVAAGAILNRYYWSEDGGKTWQSGKLESKFGVFGDPVLISDWKGNLYYAHLSDPNKQGWASPSLLDRIVIQKSTDGGKTYNNGSYCGFNMPKDQDKHWLVADPKTNNIYCSWTEFDKYASKEHDVDKSRILFSMSTNDGQSWSEALQISEKEGNCEDDDFTPEGAVPAAGPNGEVYIAWSFDDKIWFDRSLDSGKSWMEHDIVAAKQPGGWAMDIPGLTRSNGMPILVCDLSTGPNRGTLYLNWADQRNGEDDTDIWFAKSTDGGTTWSEAKRVNDDKPGSHQFLPWMAIDQTTGNLYVVYYDRRAYADEQTDVYLAVSKDGGETFENIKISEKPFKPNPLLFFGDYNHISAHKGRVRPIWTRMDDGVMSVWTALIDMK